MTRYRVVLTKRARWQIALIDEWWCANRPSAPDRVAEELERTRVRLATAPHLGVVYTEAPFPGVRRVLMPSTGFHVYYSIVHETRVVLVLSVWHTARGSGPDL